MARTDDAQPSDADELLAAARDLEAGAGRRPRGAARRRGRTLHDGAVHDDEQVADPPERARVRSETHEGPAHAADDAEVADADLLGASGTPIVAPGASLPDTDARASTAPAQMHGSAAVVEPAVFLVMAVRSYLDGLDAHGPQDPVTLDRLTRLRETLALYDGDPDV